RAGRSAHDRGSAPSARRAATHARQRVPRGWTASHPSKRRRRRSRPPRDASPRRRGRPRRSPPRSWPPRREPGGPRRATRRHRFRAPSAGGDYCSWRSRHRDAGRSHRVTAAVLFWLLVEVIGVLALPAGRRLFGRLPGGGLAFSRPLGLLLAAYPAWLLA